MLIGILGGSFNPPHQGHLHISLLAIKRLKLNQLWWIPTLHNPQKKINYNCYQDRLKLCKEIIKQNPKITVKNYQEIYTIKLIARLQKKYRHDQFVWIMGADNFEKFHAWKNFKELIKTIPIAIFSRANHLLKIRQTKAFSIYENIKNSINYDFQSKRINYKFYHHHSLINNFQHHHKIDWQKHRQANNYSAKNHLIKPQFNYKIINFSKQKLLPNFLIYQTKLNDLSSTKIREISLKK